ncbi:SDR family oxidoreductase [Gottfriedia solisilvae]|uniref:3-ketoacyl-ACP reductase n=1 Tax=Gottfriedia solisilvae TaxID=1516104 RepID=A0A8J3EWE6_9BACI|nr:SDR family oxidoreductase [Gottfriedia solisilvae]GGI10191.1 3-ketoacyl-ACP reductase [Gottfriedia solisilvae]
MKHAVITAGTKGLGKKVTESFLKEGYSVTVTYFSDDQAMNQRKEEWKEYSDRILFLKGNITDKEFLKEITTKTMKKFGRIDCLINNAGPYLFNRKKLADYSEEEWEYLLYGNLHSVFYLLKQIIPIMREQKFGRIINYGFQGANSASGWIYRSAFSTAKVGLVSLTKTIAYEEAEHGITSNMICPGDIYGEMKEASRLDALQKGSGNAPVGRFGTGEDIARMVQFLCKDESDFITGDVIEITGGLDVIHKYRHQSL